MAENVTSSFSPSKLEQKRVSVLAGSSPDAAVQVTAECTGPASPPLPTSVHPDISHVHFSAAEIDARTREMGREISLAYTGVDDLLVLGVLKGCFVFLADIVRAIDPVPNGMTVDFIKASSYGGGVSSSGEVKVNMNVDSERIKGKHILLCPNEFVVGFGLDFDEKYRSLPYIGVLRPHVYAHLNL
ncbi:MAG: hypothetical protein WDW38_002962 [Sanguina aurantia]